MTIDTDRSYQPFSGLIGRSKGEKDKQPGEERRGKAQKNVFVMYRFLRSHVVVSKGCMCERALCLRTRFLGLANQMD